MDMFNHWLKKARRHIVVEFERENDVVYEVETPMNPMTPTKGNHKHTVELRLGKCTCNKFQQRKMPCLHVIVVCMHMNLDPFQYFDSVWELESNIAIYGSQPFYPVGDRPYWPQPQVKRFRNEMDWVKSQPSKTQTCALCGQQGHNR
ncbi:hypothetical protein Vadar_031323 [Vaccinium darrowii]|uniref:Uncharacterized protein n=1 Tax=Vaccinium darrowii TaxID=229202 RepID=A0ACB7Z0R0_9ERIC|nr:hypothetical protein Vadar_031323 [Vaccinium darrowii]